MLFFEDLVRMCPLVYTEAFSVVAHALMPLRISLNRQM